MRHGFKARAERLAMSARELLGKDPLAPLDPWQYAEALGVFVLELQELELSPDCRRRLTVTDSESWSGMTITEAGQTAVVLNPSHARTRQCSTLMHELSHIALKHVPARVDISENGMMLLSDYSEEDESEADWLAAAMLLPREALIRLRGRNASSLEISQEFGVSVQLCEWRLRMTGVDLQLRRRR